MKLQSPTSWSDGKMLTDLLRRQTCDPFCCTHVADISGLRVYLGEELRNGLQAMMAAPGMMCNVTVPTEAHGEPQTIYGPPGFDLIASNANSIAQCPGGPKAEVPCTMDLALDVLVQLPDSCRQRTDLLWSREEMV